MFLQILKVKIKFKKCIDYRGRNLFMLKRPNHTTQSLKSKPRGYLYNNEMILQGRVMSQIKPLEILIINPAHKMTRTLKHTSTLFV